MAREDDYLPITRRNGPPAAPTSFDPLLRLRSEVDRLFDDFPGRLSAFTFGQARTSPVPAMEMVEDDNEYCITAELPGIGKDDVEITLAGDELCIAGEKKSEREEKKEGFMLSERSYGSFERRVLLPEAADADKIKAVCKNGVLTVIVPKDEKAKPARRKIAVED